MNDTTRLTIPMPNQLRKQLVERATNLGFDSAQALLRYASKAIVDERTDMFGKEDSWGQPSPKAAARLNRWTEEAKRDLKAGKLKGYATAEEFLQSLR